MKFSNFFRGPGILRNLLRILASNNGGVHKRIDENRELLALLAQDAPNFLANHQWVTGWLKSNDEFFCSLAEQLPPDDALNPKLAEHRRPGSGFPRPWPGDIVKDLTSVDQPANRGWHDHAYPLQQITVQLQGTKHSEPAGIIAQLQVVHARLTAGDKDGEDSDDDFGYRFTVSPASNGPSFFDAPFSHH